MGSVAVNVPLTQIPFVSAAAEKVKGLRWQRWDRSPVAHRVSEVAPPWSWCHIAMEVLCVLYCTKHLLDCSLTVDIEFLLAPSPEGSLSEEWEQGRL